MSIKSSRRKIDEIDDEILRLLVRRCEVVLEIAEIKHREKIPVRDKERERQMFESQLVAAEKLGLNPDAVRKVFDCIIKHSLIIQLAAADGGRKT